MRENLGCTDCVPIDEGSLRGYIKRYRKGGAERLIKDEYRGGLSYLSDPQKRELETHVCIRTYLCAQDIIRCIEQRFGVRYSISGVAGLLHEMGFSYKKPKVVPEKSRSRGTAGISERL